MHRFENAIHRLHMEFRCEEYMRHIYLNKLCCTCFDFLLRSICKIHTQAHRALRYKEARLYARFTRSTCRTHSHGCIHAYARLCIAVCLFTHTHAYTSKNSTTCERNVCGSCTVLFVYQWLEAPNRNTRIRQRNNVKCTKKIYQHTQPNKPVSV